MDCDDDVGSYHRWDRSLEDAVVESSADFGFDRGLLFPNVMELRTEMLRDGQFGERPVCFVEVMVEEKVGVKVPTCDGALGSQIQDEITRIRARVPNPAFLYRQRNLLPLPLPSLSIIPWM